jgi:hypothetical protein
MTLHYMLAEEPPGCRRLRRWAPLLVLLWLIALVLTPGLVAGDRPFQTSLCAGLEQAPDACAALVRTVLATTPPDGRGLILPQ